MRNPEQRHVCEKCGAIRKEKFMRIVRVLIQQTGKHAGRERTVWECCDCDSNPKNKGLAFNGVPYGTIPIEFKKPENGK